MDLHRKARWDSEWMRHMGQTQRVSELIVVVKVRGTANWMGQRVEGKYSLFTHRDYQSG